MIIFTLIFLVLDLISKFVIYRFVDIDVKIRIIRNFLYITHVDNTGVAWSLFDTRVGLILIVSLLIIIGIIIYLYKNKPTYMIEKIAYSMILGGAIGNFVNRLVCGYVIDFIDIRIFDYNYPIFNLADTFIVIGVIILIIFTWRHDKNGTNCKRK